MSLGQIIRDKREQLKLTLDEVSRRVGFSKPYLSTIETGKVKNPPSDELLSRLERVLQFETGLLMHMAHIERMPSDIRGAYESKDAENQKLRQYLKRLTRNKKGKGASEVEAMLSKTSFSVEGGKSGVAAGRLVPIINRVAAGYPTDFGDLDYPVGVADDYVRCPDLHDPNAFAVRVIGDSMEPKFHQGDIVVFSPAVEVRNGDDCFIRFTQPHETTFKRVFFEADKKIRLQPRNEQYSPTIMDGKRIDGIYRAIIRYERL
jgi:phage repressor protein C with HTH and peptisase S24 domain